jgi:CO/xanthine dehydrogenase FAD-binding subunit
MKTLVEFKHVNARTLNEATEALSGDNAMAIAGVTDLLGTLRFSVLRDASYPTTLVNLKTIDGLDYIKEEGGTLKIGALFALRI